MIMICYDWLCNFCCRRRCRLNLLFIPTVETVGYLINSKIIQINIIEKIKL